MFIAHRVQDGYTKKRNTCLTIKNPEKKVSQCTVKRWYRQYQNSNQFWLSNIDITEYPVKWMNMNIAEVRGWHAISQRTGNTELTPRAEPPMMRTTAPAVPLRPPQQAQAPPWHNHFTPPVDRARPQLEVVNCLMSYQYRDTVEQAGEVILV